MTLAGRAEARSVKARRWRAGLPGILASRLVLSLHRLLDCSDLGSVTNPISDSVALRGGDFRID